MAFQARHRFVIQKINDLLAINDEGFVEEMLQKESNFDALYKFLKATGPDVLFFYYQAHDSVDEEGNAVAGMMCLRIQYNFILVYLTFLTHAYIIYISPLYLYSRYFSILY